MARRFAVLGMLAVVLALAPAGRASACDHDLPKVAYLGIGDFECDCTTNFQYRSKDGQGRLERNWIFRSEPVVGSVNAGGPSAGRLREGDVLTAVDGSLITTRDGSARFSSMRPGQVVRFTVRRDGKEIPVAIRVGEICPEELGGVFSPGELIAPRAPRTPAPIIVRVPKSPRATPTPAPPAPGAAPPAPPAPEADAQQFRWLGRAFNAPRIEGEGPVFLPQALPAGWLGFGLRCQDCGGELEEGAKQPVWRFGTLPTISYVDPEGPSARAGLRRGDQLTHIDGVSLVTEAGGKKFGAVQPGQAVRWRVIREGKPMNLVVTAAQRPGEEGPALSELREQLKALREANRDMAESRQMQDVMRQLGELDRLRSVRDNSERRLRYAGSVAGSDVEVRGLGNVVVDDSGDEVVIITRDATIRIRPGEKTPRIERKREKK